MNPLVRRAMQAHQAIKKDPLPPPMRRPGTRRAALIELSRRFQRMQDETAEQIVPPAPYPTIALIVDEVATYYGVLPLDLLSERRGEKIVHPRWVAMYLCRYLTTRGYATIGREIGDRDHSTVKHAIDSITQRLLDGDGMLERQIEQLSKLIVDKAAAQQKETEAGVS